MAAIDRDILLEALSALTGAQVKHHHEMQPHQKHQLLQLEHFLHTIISNQVLLSSASDIPLLRNELFVDMEDFFDPQYDCDFQDKKDCSTCTRGGEVYMRPFGWYRFALKVLNRYPEGNAWLGTNGWRSESDPGEWPVSFHGTSIEGAKGIAKENYRAGPRGLYGRGIYSTFAIKVAETYTKKFTSEKNGKTYEVIMQNRINLKKCKFTERKDYWLIPIPEGTPHDKEKEMVNCSIRPYGILIKEV